MAVVPHETGFAGKADECAHVVEELDDGEGQHDAHDAVIDGAPDIEGKEHGADVRNGEAHDVLNAVRYRRHAHCHGGKGGAEDADDHGAFHVVGHEHGGQNKSETGEQGLRLQHMPEGHEGGFVRDDDPGVLHAYEGDEHAYAHNDGALERERHGVDEHLPYLRDREQEEDHARYEDGAEGHGPVQAHGGADVIGEEGVEAHARRDGHGEVGPQSHDGRGEDRRQNGGGDGRLLGHARVGEHVRVDENNVGNGHEGRESGQHFLARRGALFPQMEKPFQNAVAFSLFSFCHRFSLFPLRRAGPAGSFLVGRPGPRAAERGPAHSVRPAVFPRRGGWRRTGVPRPQRALCRAA